MIAFALPRTVLCDEEFGKDEHLLRIKAEDRWTDLPRDSSIEGLPRPPVCIGFGGHRSQCASQLALIQLHKTCKGKETEGVYLATV
jgi:hypothetical protein